MAALLSPSCCSERRDSRISMPATMSSGQAACRTWHLLFPKAPARLDVSHNAMGTDARIASRRGSARVLPQFLNVAHNALDVDAVRAFASLFADCLRMRDVVLTSWGARWQQPRRTSSRPK